MQNFSIHPREILTSFWRNRGLTVALIKREVIGRYKGSIIGVLWSLINPVLMLTVYTFFFSVVFKARWPGGSESKTEFALTLFAGLLIFNFFSECVGRAPSLILGNVNYVKKVVFPLEILPFVGIGAAGFHFLASLAIWLSFYLVFYGTLTFEMLYLPVIIVPLIFWVLGFSWLLASFGVYLRDVNQIVSAIIPALMLLSPVFYPISSLPEQMHILFQLNPLTYLIEQTRGVLIWKQDLIWETWLIQTLLAGIFAWVGYAWFQKTRKGFADVL